MRRSVTALVLPVLVTALVMGASTLAGAVPGSGHHGTSSGHGTSPSPTTSRPIEHPTGADDVILQVTNQGGFVPVEYSLSTVPSYTLLGDGTVIVQAPTILIYPGPAIAPLNQFTLTENQIQKVLGAAEQAGLVNPEPIDYGDMGEVGVADASTTTLVLNAAGRTVRHDAYALSFDDSYGGGLSEAQRQARRALAAFLEGLPQDSEANAVPYRPEELAVYVAPYRGEPEGGDPVVWPLDSDLDTVGTEVSSGLEYRCVSVTGEDLTTLLQVLGTANSRTRWLAESGADQAYGLVVRPVIPGTSGCSGSDL